jgi:hypothetical protein
MPSIQAPNLSRVIWIHSRVSIAEAVSEQEVVGTSRGRNTDSLRILFLKEGTTFLHKFTFNPLRLLLLFILKYSRYKNIYL